MPMWALHGGKAQHVFQKLADVGAAEAEIAVFALGHASDEALLKHFL